MKKDLSKIIEIPEGVEVNIEGNLIKIKGKEGEIKKEFKIRSLEIEIKEGKIIISKKKATKNDKKIMNTIFSHIQNMIQGVQEKFEYQLKIVSSHFPITVEIKDNEAIIKNFLGEKIPRKSKIIKGAEIKIEKDIIKINSIDKELAGQTAANFEKATKIRNKDKRVFQDGIYLINKAGKEI